MINSKKKGFTIVELVIVVAVVAILAAVLIPTFSSLVRKANISSDTVVAKNLNTALALYDAENDIEDFDDVLEGIKEAGYLIANLNAKASGCFFVWEKDSNQILLVDSKEEYKTLKEDIFGLSHIFLGIDSGATPSILFELTIKPFTKLAFCNC